MSELVVAIVLTLKTMFLWFSNFVHAVRLLEILFFFAKAKNICMHGHAHQPQSKIPTFDNWLLIATM